MTSPARLPLQQSEDFLRAARRLDWPVEAARDAGARRWLQARRRVPGLGQAILVSRGPVEGIRDWLDETAPGLGTVVLNAEGVTAERLRRAGFWPLVTPATLALLPLGAAPDMRRALRPKWRNRLARAERAGLVVRASTPTADQWLLAAESRQAREKGYRGWPPALSAAYARANPGRARNFEALSGGVPVAGVLVLCHPPGATWQIGHSTAAGRAQNAMPLLLWHAMLWGAEQGCAELDLGALDTARAPGLARFKLGTGARPHALSGTWVRHRALAPLARRLPAFWAR